MSPEVTHMKSENFTTVEIPLTAFFWGAVGVIFFSPLGPTAWGAGLMPLPGFRMAAFILGCILGKKFVSRFGQEDGFWLGAKIGIMGSALTWILGSFLSGNFNILFIIVFLVLFGLQHFVAAFICGLCGLFGENLLMRWARRSVRVPLVYIIVIAGLCFGALFFKQSRDLAQTWAVMSTIQGQSPSQLDNQRSIQKMREGTK